MNGQIDIGDLRPSRYFLAVGVVLGLAFFLVSPDDEVEHSLLNLAILWQIQTLVPLALAVLLQKWIINAPALKRLGAWLRLALSGLLASAVATPIALVAESLLQNEKITEPIGQALLLEFLNIFPVVTLCWLAINAPFQLGYRLSKRSEHERNALKGERDLPEFYDLITHEEHGDLIYLKSELHYLSVHTTKGKNLILYSLAKAVDELGDSGIQVHRSYWVSDAHVQSVHRSGREGEIELSNDERIPVSRRKLAAAQQRYS